MVGGRRFAELRRRSSGMTRERAKHPHRDPLVGSQWQLRVMMRGNGAIAWKEGSVVCDHDSVNDDGRGRTGSKRDRRTYNAARRISDTVVEQIRPAGRHFMNSIRRTAAATVPRTILLIGVVGACTWAGSAALGRPTFAASGQSVAQPMRPNLLFILTDDQDVGTLRFMPRVQALLAAEGLTFPNTFAVQPLCCPSRASILRGQYPHNTQIVHNAPPVGGFAKFRDLGHETSTLAVWLRAAGYRTAFFGKYLNGYPTADRPDHVPPGWDEWYGAHEGPVRYYNYRMTENGRVVGYGDGPGDYRTDVLTEKAVSFIETRQQGAAQPFFLYFSVPAPHADRPGDGPAIPAPRHRGALADLSAPRPPSFNEADIDDKPSEIQPLPMLTGNQVAEIDEEFRTRVESLLAVDEAVERLVRALSARGELENT